MLLQKLVRTPLTRSSVALDKSLPARLQTPWRQDALKELKISLVRKETPGDWLEDWISVELCRQR